MSCVDPAEWQPQGVDELEDRAWEALREVDRSVCVTAGAGAGKTEFLAQKATFLLQTGLCPPPKRILAISFKRDAADTLAKRVKLRCSEGEARRFVSLTFDAFMKGLVDQFRAAIPEPYAPSQDYEIAFPTIPIINEFFQGHEIEAINPGQFIKGVARARLPIEDQHQIPDELRNALALYWQEQYQAHDQTLLSFDMLNRLADYLIRSHDGIRQSLRGTYPFVFLDEFQDTTYPQFEVLLTAFDPLETTFTAVGDDKQKIMGWAGAMDNAFEGFRNQCNARPVNLLLNWRSHDDLVQIQHLIAQRIDADVEPPEARAECEVDGDISAIWEFDDREDEVASLAAWLGEAIDDDGIEPHRIAILVRMRANDVEEELGPVFAEQGINLRNVARNVGDIAIQELLVESLTENILPFLRAGSSSREPDAWADSQEIMGGLLAISEDDDEALQLATANAERVISEVRQYMEQNAPDADTAEEIAGIVIEEIGESVLRQANPAYSREGDFGRVRAGLIELLRECADEAEGWPTLLDRFEGKGQVALMTVHKAKGMEFHTMIFVGLDRQNWWSLTPNRREELNSFFVAFTRAEQRAFFTHCNERGGRIGWLDDLLGDAVRHVRGCG